MGNVERTGRPPGARAAWDGPLDAALTVSLAVATLGLLVGWVDGGLSALPGPALVPGPALAGVLWGGWWAYARRGHRWPLVVMLAVLALSASTHPVMMLGLGAIIVTAVHLGRSWGRVGVALTLLTVVASTVLNDVVRDRPVGPLAGLAVMAAAWTAISGMGLVLRVEHRGTALAEQRGVELAEAYARLADTAAAERELLVAEERARTATQVHEGLGEQLRTVSASLAAARACHDRGGRRATALVQQAAAANLQALDTMRMWARALHPPPASPRPVADGGMSVLEPVAEAFRGTGLAVDVRHHGPSDVLPADVSAFAGRFIQEGLAGVVRDGRADRVLVEVRQSAHEVRVEVRADREAAVPDGDPGLTSLRERAQELDGDLTCGPAAEGGWQLVTVLPLAAVQAPASLRGRRWTAGWLSRQEAGGGGPRP